MAYVNKQKLQKNDKLTLKKMPLGIIIILYCYTFVRKG